MSEDCYSCGDEDYEDTCPKSERPCKHHCNHFVTHDACCWCRKLNYIPVVDGDEDNVHLL